MIYDYFRVLRILTRKTKRDGIYRKHVYTLLMTIQVKELLFMLQSKFGYASVVTVRHVVSWCIHILCSLYERCSLSLSLSHSEL